LGFDLNGFPTETIDIVTAGLAEVNEMELRYLQPPNAVEESLQSGPDNPLKEISPEFDGDFCDEGFCLALSYGQTICARGNAADRVRLETIEGDTVARLAAIVEFFEKQAAGAVSTHGEVSSYRSDASESLPLPAVSSVRFTVRTPAGVPGIDSLNVGVVGVSE